MHGRVPADDCLECNPPERGLMDEEFMVINPNSDANPTDGFRVVRIGEFLKVYHGEKEASWLPFVDAYSTLEAAEARCRQLSTPQNWRKPDGQGITR